ncbi:LURP-one-related family protein [Vescimonas sp.]|uniref:LURP-one-related/scramblase family protein n=1 Tax=Vescimonas sp. TaxID=2892404 RepID=UPI0030775252
MKLYFKQRFFSWFDSYDIYDYDTGDVVYTVEGQLAWGHCLHILDADGRHIATVKQRVLTFLPKFDLYLGDACIGTICKEFTIVRPLFTLNFNGWQVEGDFMGWEYEITDGQRQVAAISKELLHWTDTYVIDVADGRDGLCALMVVLAIDAEKCSHNS